MLIKTRGTPGERNNRSPDNIIPEFKSTEFLHYETKFKYQSTYQYINININHLT